MYVILFLVIKFYYTEEIKIFAVSSFLFFSIFSSIRNTRKNENVYLAISNLGWEMCNADK